MADEVPLSSARKWTITFSVMCVTVMQILDTSVTNVALPHMQGALSAGVEEISWVLSSYLAANAIILPATGWLSSLLGRKRFFMICTVLFTVSSFLSGIAPNLEWHSLGEIVPSSFTLTGHQPVMIISGANAGGKTVVLKTAGLLSLMAISGLPVPARAATIPFYQSVLADIGDHQSLSVALRPHGSTR